MSIVPPASALSVLGLNARDVRVTAQTADGYGSLLAQTSKPSYQARAATMKIRAAACWCLVSPTRAPATFSQARRLYEGLGHPFAIALAICAGEQALPSVGSRQSMAPDGLAYGALWHAWSIASRMTTAGAELVTPAYDRDWFPAGQLGVPVRLYLEFARGVADAIGGENSGQLARSLPQLLQRGTEPVRMAMADQYHWEALATGVMPVEPELLAIGRIAHRTLAPWDEGTLTNLRIPRNSVERIPLWIARVLEEPPGSPSPPPGPGGRPLPSAPVDENATTRI